MLKCYLISTNISTGVGFTRLSFMGQRFLISNNHLFSSSKANKTIFHTTV